MKHLYIGLLCLFCTNFSLSQNRDLLTTELNHKLDSLAKENHLVGFSVALYNEEGSLYQNGFGLADVDQNLPYTENTIQNIGSISKTFIGVALLKAQELGDLDLDDPINQYLPFKVHNPYHPNEVITIRQLANHTSSIVDRDWWYGFNCYILKEKKKAGEKKEIYFSQPDKMMTLAEIYESYLSKDGKAYKKKSFSKHQPGSVYQYSNIAAALAAYILEIATEQDFDQFTQEHIFKPLQMEATGWSFDSVSMEDHTILYTKKHKPLAYYRLVTYPDGGLITSASDMSKYATELIKGYHGKGQLLSNTSYQEAFTGGLDASNFLGEMRENCGVFFESL